MADDTADAPKLILLTGANSGIGLEATKLLCSRGHRLVVTVRSAEKGDQCIRDVKAAVPKADINYILCEMSDPKAVRSFAEEFKAKWLVNGQYLDVLVNNAGAVFAGTERVLCETNPKWEKTVAVNAIAPILLTDLLIDSLKETATAKGEARIVMVNSSITKAESLVAYQTDLDDVMIAKPGAYKGGMQAYKNSKVVFMLASLAMADELDGSGVTLNALCPGLIPGTNLFLSNAQESQRCGLKCFLNCCGGPCFGQSTENGGKYITQVADEEHGKSHGLFFLRGDLVDQAPQCQDKSKQKQMLQILRDLPNESG